MFEFSSVDKTEEMIGSYGPQETPYEKKFLVEEAPSGILARGHYEAKVQPDFFCLCIKWPLDISNWRFSSLLRMQSKFVDDDNTVHMEWSWSFDIKKDW